MNAARLDNHTPTTNQRDADMTTRKALDGQAIALMLALCFVWGLQQVVLKATAADIAPVFQIGLRSGVAAVLVGLMMAARGERMRVSDGTWRAGIVVGLLFGFEFLLVAEGLRHTSASHMVVFLYTAPIFAALGLHWKLPAERLGVVQWVGIALAFSGLALAFFGRDQSTSPVPGNALWGDFLGLIAGVSWGATTVVVRSTRLASAPATQTLLYQLVVAFVLLVATAFLTGQTSFRPTPQVWASLVFQSVVVSFASFLVWFWLLRHYLASRLGVFSFLTPLFGIVLGAWLLSEPVEASFLMGGRWWLAGGVCQAGGER
jgi:drug/metabolite transporter (DMT)-like permease